MDIDKDFPADDDDVKVDLGNRLDELSKRRLNLLGYNIYRKCSLGEPVSNVELSERLSKLSKRYPNLTLENLIDECKLKDKPDKFTSENPYTLEALNIISEENLLPEDIIQNVLPGYLQLEKHIDRYTNGNISRMYTHIGGVKQGKYISYFMYTKNKSVEANYTDGKLNGKYTTYYEDGSKLTEENYTYGKLNGKYIEYNPNGSKLIEANYINGKLNGPVIHYRLIDDNIVDFIENYKDDKLNGDTFYYNLNGVLTRKITYKDNMRIMITDYYTTGENNIKTEYLLKEGSWADIKEKREWYPGGQLKKVIKYSKYGIPSVNAWKEDGTKIKYATLRELTDRL